MGDVNEDSNSSSGPVFYGEKTLTNGHYYNGFIQRMVADANLGFDKEALKLRILEHEAIFKDQVYELHRLYRRHIYMLEEVRRSEYPRQRISIDTSLSSSLLRSKKPYEDGQKWQIPSFPSFNSCARPSLFGADISNSTLSCSKGRNNNNSPKDCERPSKVRKRLFDLELPPDEHIDHEASVESSFMGGSGLADLNESINVEESNGSLTHKLTSFQKQPSFLSSQSNVVFGAKWRMNGCYTANGFCHGSSSGSKDPCARLRYHRNYNNLDDRPEKIFKGSNFMDLPDTTKGIDLNNDSNSSSKCDDRTEKILGFSVLGYSCISRNESSSLVSTSATLRCPHENGKLKTEVGSRGFDINIAWDDHENKQADTEACNLEKKTGTGIGKIKNYFDLNSCLTEDEDVLVPEFVKSSNEKAKKIRMEIDLEAPAVPEAEEEEEPIDEVKRVDHFDDKFLAKAAAEAIVAMTGISGQHEVTFRSDDNDRLLWFAEVIEKAGYVSNEPDEYEELTLKQELTKEEDYMPKPLAPDFQELDEAGPLAGLTRPRRGQARWGRPRRDFQREILPGLVSLSRREITEDLEIF